MKEIGIVRRIDELGRVVVPKEIRKTLRIKHGDPLEIYADKEQLIIKKYSPVAAIGDLVESIAEGVEKIIEKNCIVTDTDKVIVVSGKNKDFVGKTLSSKMTEIMNRRKSVLVSVGDGGEPINVTDDDKGAENQIIVPVVTGGDCYGTIIIYDDDKTKRFSSADVKFVRMCAFVLSKQFEE